MRIMSVHYARDVSASGLIALIISQSGYMKHFYPLIIDEELFRVTLMVLLFTWHSFWFPFIYKSTDWPHFGVP